LFDQKCTVIQEWCNAGKIAPVNPQHLIFSIWSTTQHYADFAAQIDVLVRPKIEDADTHLRALFFNILKTS
nr:TetR family transcriptional regulator C-terminal domain-containing protein [Alphaproteobacteria bacterium]